MRFYSLLIVYPEDRDLEQFFGVIPVISGMGERKEMSEP